MQQFHGKTEYLRVDLLIKIKSDETPGRAVHQPVSTPTMHTDPTDHPWLGLRVIDRTEGNLSTKSVPKTHLQHAFMKDHPRLARSKSDERQQRTQDSISKGKLLFAH